MLRHFAISFGKTIDFVVFKIINNIKARNFGSWGIISDPAMAITNFLPKTRAVVDRIYNFLQSRPALYNMVLSIAQKHDNWMDYRKYGKFPLIIISQ
jgi:hypothetical protein